VLPVVVVVVGCVVVDDVVDVVDRDPVGVSFLAVVVVEVVVVVDLDMLPVGVHVVVDVDCVLAVVVVDLVLEFDKDKTLSLNNSSFSLSEALLEDDDGEPEMPEMTTKQELLSLLPKEVARQSHSGRQCSAGEGEDEEDDPEAC
jgi:hypothetical protein